MSNVKLPKPPPDFENIAATKSETLVDKIIEENEVKNNKNKNIVVEDVNENVILEDPKEKRLLINNIKAYLLSPYFGEYIREMVPMPPDLNNCTIQELKEFISDIQISLNSRGNNRMITQIAHFGLVGYEYIACNHLGIKCQGLSNILIRNAEFQEILEEIRLKHGSLFKLPPEIRLALLVFQTSKMMDSQNSIEKDVKEKCKGPISEELYNEFKDL